MDDDSLIGVDTNVLVRLLVQDDPVQSARALEALSVPNVKFVIQPIVLCEVVWVLSRAYKYQKRQIKEALVQILRVKNFFIVDKEQVLLATDLYSSSELDFADAYIGIANEKAGCKTSITFDKAAAESNLYSILD